MPEGASLALGDAGTDPKADSPKSARARRDRAGGALLAEDASDRRARKARERERNPYAEVGGAGSGELGAAVREAGAPREVAAGAAAAESARDAGSARNVIVPGTELRVLSREAGVKGLPPLPEPRSAARDAGASSR
jgi:hypothetical protein